MNREPLPKSMVSTMNVNTSMATQMYGKLVVKSLTISISLQSSTEGSFAYMVVSPLTFVRWTRYESLLERKRFRMKGRSVI